MAELVESTTLLTWQGLIALKGSNPFLSATETPKGVFKLRRERDSKDGGAIFRASEELKRVRRVRVEAT